MNIYVGNLSREATEDELRQAFGQYGQVSSVAIIKDRLTGESRGFGFIEMAAREEAEAAIRSMNGQELKGRNLTVNEARPKNENRNRFGGDSRRY